MASKQSAAELYRRWLTVPATDRGRASEADDVIARPAGPAPQRLRRRLGESVDGGFEEFREFCFNCRRNSRFATSRNQPPAPATPR